MTNRRSEIAARSLEQYLSGRQLHRTVRFIDRLTTDQGTHKCGIRAEAVVCYASETPELTNRVDRILRDRSPALMARGILHLGRRELRRMDGGRSWASWNGPGATVRRRFETAFCAVCTAWCDQHGTPSLILITDVAFAGIGKDADAVSSAQIAARSLRIVRSQIDTRQLFLVGNHTDPDETLSAWYGRHTSRGGIRYSPLPSSQWGSGLKAIGRHLVSLGLLEQENVVIRSVNEPAVAIAMLGESFPDVADAVLPLSKSEGSLVGLARPMRASQALARFNRHEPDKDRRLHFRHFVESLITG